MNTLRSFIAIDIPPTLKKNIHLQINKLRNIIGDSAIHWVSVPNIHLTLKFLGNITSADVDTLAEIIQTQAATQIPFDISTKGLGSFPSSKRPRVLLIRIQAPAELEALQLKIESACGAAGFRPETRPFSPHLTIGRLRRGISSSDQIKIRKTLDEVKIDSLGKASVDSIHLYKSKLKPTGSVYTKLFSAPLQR